MGTEQEFLEDARRLMIEERAPIPGQSATAIQQRAEGAFLRALMTSLQPMLRRAMRSRRVLLAHDAFGAIMLRSDGTFVRVDAADQEEVLEPQQVLWAEPVLDTVLERIRAELDAAGDPDGIPAADLVRLARHSLRAAAAAAR